ncbi:hypothetical protein PHISCL_00382 [Aspergillus sclerotialis]|uniref:Uncharacterized protein n=1 Tax=Aspergillus sclerotialis TaxID=2070753 RepID=A0A3A3AD71_9EURO|nr:hypothetical protein PHISCL_00382 [Aspergillus sclerotialis]
MPVERSVSLIGLGLMGSALARIFVNQGWKTTVWNRSSAKVDTLVAKGALPAASVTECIGASNLVIICLINAQAVHDVLGDADAHSCAGRSLINYTSGTRVQAQQTQEIAMKLSFSAYLHGAVLASPETLGLPQSPIYYAGDEEVFRSIESDFKILGRSVYLGDDLALAPLIGCIMMDAFFGLAVGFLQSTALLRTSRLYSAGGAERFLLEELVPFFSHCQLTTLSDFARQIDNRKYLRGDGNGMPLSLLVQTLDNMSKTHHQYGLCNDLFGPLLNLMRARVAQGGAAEEMSSLIKVIPEPGSRCD